MRKVAVTLSVGIALIAATAAVAMTGSPPRTVRQTAPIGGLLANISSDITICQANEVLPAGVSAVRLWMWAFFGSTVHVRIFSGSQILTEGHRNAAWTSQSVTVPVKPVDRTTAKVRLCFSLEPNSEPMLILGTTTPASQAATVMKNGTPKAELATHKAQTLIGRVKVDYVAPGRVSWWSQVVSVARRLGLGHVFSGTWIAFLLAAVMAGVGVLTVRLTLREIS